MIPEYPIVHLAHVHVEDSNYNVVITVCTTTGHIHIFKYDSYRCEYDQFDNEREACEFLNTRLPGH